MKKKKIAAVILAVMIGITAFSGCGTKENKSPADTSGTGSSVEAQEDTGKEAGAGTTMLEDGMYSVNVELQGGSGRATVDSVANVTVTDGQAMATIVWSSTYYDYMIVDDEKYLNENEGGNSTFTFPITGVPCEMEVIGDTTAMSTPHEIEYTLVFSFPETTSFNELNCEGHMNLAYADQFSIEQYGAYKLITIVDSGRYLLVPKGVSVPADVPSDIVVLQQPLDSIYLVSSSVMDQFVALDALDSISLSGTKQDGWYIDEAKQAMADGKITYAGKYSAPDYETIYSADCNLAIENTMIYHTPEVKEQLEKLGIPVFVERSSYEPHALGRMEWIKVYGTLLGCEDKAEKLFADKVDGIVDILQKPAAGKTVSFFYITSNGAANVRKSTDYIAEMISLAGGKYIFDDLTDDTAKSTVNMQMESFYAGAKDADVMIYNATIDSELQTLDQLLEKSPLLADFKAVKTGNVWCTEKNLYQSTMELDELIRDFHTVIADGDPSTLKYLHKLS